MSGEDENVGARCHHVVPTEQETSEGEDGLSHHSDRESEVEVVGEPLEVPDGKQRMLRAPKMPTQAEVDAHKPPIYHMQIGVKYA